MKLKKLYGSRPTKANIQRRLFIESLAKLFTSLLPTLISTGRSHASEQLNTYKFNSIADLKSGVDVDGKHLSLTLRKLLDHRDCMAKTKCYLQGSDKFQSSIGGANYVLTTLSRARKIKGKKAWLPDGFGEHYLFSQTEFVAILQITKFVTPQMFGASITNKDNNDELQAFAKWLPNFPVCKSDEIGTMLATHIVFPPLYNFSLDFTGLIFKIKDGHNPLGNELIRFDSLQNGTVRNFVTNGNKDKVIDVQNDISNFGRILNWRLGNNSKNVVFNGLGMYDALYCGSQWGFNIENIKMFNIHYDRIGEHVFYISGYGGGNNRNILWQKITGGSFGLNPNNSVNNIKHDTHFVKSAQTIGDNYNWTIQDALFIQSKRANYAANIVCNGDLLSITLKNIKVGMNIDAILYPTGNAHDVTIDGIEQINIESKGAGTRLIYSKVKGLILNTWKASNVKLNNVYSHTHIQMFDVISNSVLGRCDTSSDKIVEYSDIEKTVSFNNVTFTRAISLDHIEHNFEFVNCHFVNKLYRCLGNIGKLSYKFGKSIELLDCDAFEAYSHPIEFKNENCDMRIRNFKGDPRTGLQPLTMAKNNKSIRRLDIDGYACDNINNPIGNVIAHHYRLSNMITVDGKKDWTYYEDNWHILNGQSSVSHDLVNRLAVAPVRDKIKITPQTSYNSSILDNYSVSTHDFKVKVSVDSPVTESKQSFHVLVKLH